MSSRIIYAYVIGLLALALLFYMAIPYYSKQIPITIEESAKEQLSSVGASWATVKSDNRDLVLSGKAPTPQAHQVALDALEQVSAVRHIQDDTTQNLVSPYSMVVEWKDDKLVVNGYVPSEKEQQAVLNIIREKFPDKDITQNINIAQGQPEKWTELVSTMLTNMPSLERANIDLVDTNLGLSAQTEKTVDKDRFIESLTPFEPEGYTIRTHIVANDAGKLRCQRQFDELLANAQISFSSGKAIISKTSYNLLNQLTETAQACPDSSLEIAGHTDNRGLDASNLSLSRKRAESVAQWLIQSGVDKKRIKTVGYGATQPIGDNNTESGRAKNRRIEFIVRSN